MGSGSTQWRFQTASYRFSSTYWRQILSPGTVLFIRVLRAPACQQASCRQTPRTGELGRNAWTLCSADAIIDNNAHKSATRWHFASRRPTYIIRTQDGVERNTLDDRLLKFAPASARTTATAKRAEAARPVYSSVQTAARSQPASAQAKSATAPWSAAPSAPPPPGTTLPPAAHAQLLGSTQQNVCCETFPAMLSTQPKCARWADFMAHSGRSKPDPACTCELLVTAKCSPCAVAGVSRCVCLLAACSCWPCNTLCRCWYGLSFMGAGVSTPWMAMPASVLGFEPSLTAVSEAQRHARQAASALGFEDVQTAIKNLSDALRLLTQP